MRIVKGYPPNFRAIAAALPSAKTMSAIFTYGGTIYTGTGATDLSEALVAHETVHSRQQGGDPAAWWDLYLNDSQIRFEQELEAHREEFRVASAGANRHNRRAILHRISQRLAGQLYGNLVTIQEAKRLVSGDVKETA
jgi:hypothetical protein